MAKRRKRIQNAVPIIFEQILIEVVTKLKNQCVETIHHLPKRVKRMVKTQSRLQRSNAAMVTQSSTKIRRAQLLGVQVPSSAPKAKQNKLKMCGLLTLKQLICRRRIMANTPVFQTGDGVSITLACSNESLTAIFIKSLTDFQMKKEIG